MSEQLQGRELDMALAKALGHQVEWRLAAFIEGDVVFDVPESDGYISKQMPVIVGAAEPDVVPFYSTDLNTMHRVEAEIERRGLVDEYVFALPGDEAYWALVHATAEDKARAALEALSYSLRP